MDDLASQIAQRLRSSSAEPFVVRSAFEPELDTAARLRAFVNSRAIRPPRVKLFRLDGEPDPWATASGPVWAPEASDVERSIQVGAVVRLLNVEDVLPVAERIIRSLERHLPVGLRAGALYGPSSGAQSLPIHRDGFDALAFQVAGSKRWWIGPQSDLRSLPVEPSTGLDGDDPEVPPSIEGFTFVELEPGDVLLVPRGRWHLARSSDRGSLHVGVPVRPLRVPDALAWMVERSHLAEHDGGMERSPVVHIDDELIERLIREKAREDLPELVTIEQLGFPSSWRTSRTVLERPPFVPRDVIDALRARTAVGVRFHAGAVPGAPGLIDPTELPWAIRAHRLGAPRCFVLAPTPVDAEDYHVERIRAGEPVRSVDLPLLARVLADGASLVVGGAERIDPALDEMCADLEYALGESVSCNVVGHPGVARSALPARCTEEDALVVQLLGRQRWRTWGSDGLAQVQEFDLREGDALELPKGTNYQMLRGGASLHVGLRLAPIRERDLVEWAVAQRIEDLEARTALPYDKDRWPEILRDELDQTMAHLDGGGRSRAIVALDHDRGLRQLLTFGDRALAAPGRVLVLQVVRRPVVTETDGQVIIEGGGRRWTFAGAAATLARRLADCRWLATGDLPLEEAGAIDLLLDVGFAALCTWPERWGSDA